MDHTQSTLYKNLIELGVDHELIVAFCESPARADAAAIMLAILDGIIKHEQQSTMKSLFDEMSQPNEWRLAKRQGAVSLAKRLKLAFGGVLDIFKPTSPQQRLS